MVSNRAIPVDLHGMIYGIGILIMPATTRFLVSIKHIDENGRTSYPVWQHLFAGGDHNNGLRYFSFYPTKVGLYTVIFNRVVSAGGCAIPYEGRPNFLSYDLHFLPPSEEDLPEGMDVDIAELEASYANFLENQAFLEENQTEPESFAVLIGGAVSLSIVAYLLTSFLFK